MKNVNNKMVRQVALVPAGCQPWNHDVVSTCGDRFAYSATLAIYIYEIDAVYSEYRLISIMSEHKKTITSICWCPEKPDYIASASSDGLVYVWDIMKQAVVALHTMKEAVTSLGWCHNGRQCLGLMGQKGPLWLWNVPSSHNLSMVKDSSNFNSLVSMFRWHPIRHNQVAFGHEDGTVSVIELGLKIIKNAFKPEAVGEDDEVAFPIIAMEWDPLSTDYLLVCNKVLGVRLVDVPNQHPIMCFQLPSAASRVQTISWVKNAPGMFVTGDYKGGILRVWSVSNSTPLENIKIKNTGFHRLEVIDSNLVNSCSNGANSEQDLPGKSKQISSTSETKSQAMTTLSRFTLPHAQVVCTFIDGGVGVYELGHRKWTFLRDQGHIETIFDCKFKPEDPNSLATASFDGTIKIWDITTMTCLSSSPGNEGIIYHISWAPADLNCITACTARNGAFIWDVKKGKVIKRFQNHAPKTSLYSIAWNHNESRHIMTVGEDGFCIIQQVDGQVIQKYKHPGPVYGCDWSPFNKDMLATGCDDKCLRVFYMASSSDQPIKVFTGHDAKVFHIRWNPLKEGVLCSGSDDGTIRVWDYTRDHCICVLNGHSGKIRGLTWNSEVPTLLASGSWDYTIRIWDTRDGACLHSVMDHGADVYGLTSHPSRPFLLASSSRDSTVRLWSITSLVQPLELNVLVQKSWTEVFGTGEPSVGPGTDFSLSGKISKELHNGLVQRGLELHDVLEQFSKFFMHPCGTNNIWDLVSVLRGKDTMMLSSSYAQSIVHRKHLTQFKGSDAQHLEMIKMSKFGGGIGAPNKKERLMEAAQIHIRMGNIQRYCELMVELGNWERAMALAPAVSTKYWQQLNKRYCTALQEEDSDELVPFCVAGGEVNQLVCFFSSRGQLSDAMIVAQSASEGSICAPHVKGPHREQTRDTDVDRLVLDVMRNMSSSYFRNGSPILAACSHLSADDTKGAISKLIRGNELELALSIGRVLGESTKELDIVTELLSRKCEALGKWSLGLDLLQLQREPRLSMAKLCARCSSSMAEINDLHHKAGLPPMEVCESKARKLESSASESFDCVLFYLLSPSAEQGLEKGLAYVKGQLENKTWTVDDAFPMLQLLGCIKTEKLQHSKNSVQMHELLVLSSYVGAFVAIKREYVPVVLPLFNHARKVMKKEKLRLPFTDQQVEREMSLWFAASTGRISHEEREAYQGLLSHCGEDRNWPVEPGPDCVASSHLPSHSDIHMSILSSSRIRGQSYFLEDGSSAISLNEALMWAKVNPFSPLGSGVRINPF